MVVVVLVVPVFGSFLWSLVWFMFLMLLAVFVSFPGVVMFLMVLGVVLVVV